MKKIAILTAAVLFAAAAAYAHCGNCPGDKKDGKPAAAAQADKAKADCPGHAHGDKKDGKSCDCAGHGDKKTPEAKAKAKGKDCGGCPMSRMAKKDGKTGKCPVTGASADGKTTAKAGKKYACAMNCVKADKPGKCPKCGMPMEEVKPEAKK
jgi:hypothetical protein